MNKKKSPDEKEISDDHPHYQYLLKSRALERFALSGIYVSRTIATAVTLILVVMVASCLTLVCALYGVKGSGVLLQFSTLQPNVVLGFLMGGAALLLQCSPLADKWPIKFLTQILAVLMLVPAIAVLAEQLLGSASQFEHFFLLFTWSGMSGFAEMHPFVAVGFIFSGVALLVLDYRTQRQHYPAEYLASVLIFLSTIPLFGYLYDVDVLTHMMYERGVPLVAELCFLLFGLALLMSRPRHLLMAIITRHAPGGQILRRSLPQMLILLAVLNWCVDWGAREELYDYNLVPPLLTIIGGGLFLFIFWRTAGKVDQEYSARLKSAAELAEASALLIAVSDNTNDPIFVKNRTGNLIFANPACLRQFDMSWSEAKLRRSRDLFLRQEDADRIDHDDVGIMEAGVSQTIEQTILLKSGIVTFQVTKSPWSDSQGKIMGIVGIATDITERKHAEDSLRRRELELERTIFQRTALLRDLTNHIEDVREEEKRAIARELHDNMGAALTALSMHLEGVYKVFPDDPVWEERQTRIQELLRSLVATTRRIQTELRPNMLDLFGLKAAITEQLEDFGQRTGIICRASLPDENISINHKIEIAVYRMLQEILNNVAKHAQATKINVVLDVDEDRLALTICDDGIGMSQECIDNTHTHGLRGLKERASFLGGRVMFKPGRVNGLEVGTRVEIEVPLVSRLGDASDGEHLN
ncbi:PAS domain-containing protein [Glaciimonas sp. Gout2]|uniref:PAS domain-containing sensor histidine kinase n=1 Tax=unclassified Glaciimonas TaxID=2644401 RepID=UPI002B22EFCA|nr:MULTISPECIES: PAS domain-containing protein [unclassified Glaciimonas]MEB0012662.1 PAS domain-containing protein [Glaciimonas sp. Cout2]MEB0082997.1 PAS domain-containing protein [Glaciimonas sp. Gout2]